MPQIIRSYRQDEGSYEQEEHRKPGYFITDNNQNVKAGPFSSHDQATVERDKNWKGDFVRYGTNLDGKFHV